MSPSTALDGEHWANDGDCDEPDGDRPDERVARSSGWQDQDRRGIDVDGNPTSLAAFDGSSAWILQQRYIEMRWFSASIVAAVVAIGVYIGSAIVSLNGLVGAAKAGSGAEILARTDVPRLKRSLVDQIVTAYP